MSITLNARLLAASAVLAAAAVATGCSSHAGDAGGSATTAASAASTASSNAPTSTGAASASGPGTASGSGSATKFTPLPVPTTAVAAPSGGSVHETVAARTPSMLPSTALASPATLGQAGVQLKVSRVQVKATQPGDVSGPALQVVTTITNKASTPLSTSALVVNVTDADQTPLTPMTSGPFQRMATTIAPGHSATGTYVFHIATLKQPVTATVYLSPDQPTGVFTGAV